MLNITDEQKETFYLPGYTNEYELTFADIGLVIGNEQLHEETAELKESICEEGDFALGGCMASSIEYTASDVIADQISGLEFTVRLNVSNEEGNTVLSMPMGTYRVDSAQRVDDKDYKKITAYDRMYEASADVSVWYNALFPITGTQKVPSGEKDEDGNAIMTSKNIYGTTTVKAMRESLLAHLGIPYVPQTLPNDEMTIEKTIEPSAGSLPGTTALKALCTVNGGFGRMNREGKFEVIHIKGLGLFPEDSKGAAVPMEEGGNVYPEETLYPEDGFQHLGMSDEEKEFPEYRSVIYEEYMTHPITCLNIQTDEEDIGVTIGHDTTNPYVITANFLLYGKAAAELQTAGENIFRQIQGITYRPASTELDGLPYLEAGDVYALEKRTDIVESYIFSRTLTGIQALIDRYEAKGNKVRANETTPAEEIQILKRKTLKIQKSVDGVSVELEDLDKQTKGRFEVTDKNISAEVKRATTEEGELSGRLDVAAGEVVLKADANGRIVAVELTADPKNGTEFKVGADNISLTAEQAISLLSGGTINLSAEQGIEIASPYFSVDKKGDVVARSIKITGGEINFATSMDGDSSILLRNAKYEGAYDGIVRFAGYGPPPKDPKQMGAKYSDFYFDRDTGRKYVSGVNDKWAEVTIDVGINKDNVPFPLIRFYGTGEPTESPEEMDARPGELYIDLETGRWYSCNLLSQGGMYWGWTGTGAKESIEEWTEAAINTEDGFSAATYSYDKLEIGNTGEDYGLFKKSQSCNVSPQGLTFGKAGHDIAKEGPVEFDVKASIVIEERNYENDPQGEARFGAIIQSDSPIYSPNIKCGHVSRDMNANVSCHSEVTGLNMPDVPNVVATAVTSNPSAVSVSVADVSESGFKICMRRTDGNYPLRVNWIAMC